MALVFTITDAGRAALVNARNNGTDAVTITHAGLSGAAVGANTSATTLPGEFKRIATLSGEVVAADTIHLIVRDESADVFALRSVGLFLADGTLFGLYGQADVLLEKSSQALMLLAIDVRFADIDAASIQFGNANFLNPPATTERQGVAELATLAEAQAGIDALRILTPAAAKAAILGWLLAQDGSGSGLDADLLDGVQGYQFARRDQDNELTGTLYSSVAPRPVVMRIPASGSAALSWQLGGKSVYDLVSNSSGDMYFNRLNFDTGAVLSTALLLANNGDVGIGGPAYRQGNRMWDAGNDGAGSGLDADLLDGTQGAAFARRDQDNEMAGTLFSAVTPRPYVIRIPAGGSASLSWQLGGRAAYDILSNSSGDLFFNRSNAATGVFMGTPLLLGSDGSVSIGGPVNRQGNRIWDAGNDGAGSGLDADLLDGIEAASFARRDRDNTFEGQIVSQVSARPLVVRVPAGGSAGISYQLGGRAGYDMVVDAAGGLFFNRSDIGTGQFAGTTMSLASDGSIDTGGSLRRQGNQVWDAGNDGAGSGLDADLLDGLQASDFARMADFARNLSDAGYQRLPGGLILQWGQVIAPANGINQVVFPFAFPSRAIAALATNQSGVVPSAWAGAGNLARTGMTIGHASASLTPSAAGTSAFWFALGE